VTLLKPPSCLFRIKSTCWTWFASMSAAATLYTYARQVRWVESNPLVDVPRAKVVLGSPEILTVEQAARLLENADATTLPFHAFGLFGGLRAGELQRLLWEQVDFEHDLIEVTAKSSKTASRRSVTIQPNLRKWL